MPTITEKIIKKAIEILKKASSGARYSELVRYINEELPEFGLGLILFDKNNFKNPTFEIRTRAQKSEPDYFYVNKYLRLLGDDLRKLF